MHSSAAVILKSVLPNDTKKKIILLPIFLDLIFYCSCVVAFMYGINTINCIGHHFVFLKSWGTECLKLGRQLPTRKICTSMSTFTNIR